MKKSRTTTKGKVKKPASKLLEQIAKQQVKPKEEFPVKPKMGRSSTITIEATAKLRAAFSLDYTVEEACDFAEISTDAYYRKHVKSEDFRNEMAKAQRSLFKSAKRAIATEIVDGGNANMAMNFLKHRQSERYRTKNETDQPMVGNITMVLPGSKPHPRILSESEAAGLSDDL